MITDQVFSFVPADLGTEGWFDVLPRGALLFVPMCDGHSQSDGHFVGTDIRGATSIRSAPTSPDTINSARRPLK